MGKAKQRIFLLFKCFCSRDISLLIRAYKSYILPILDYCSPVWSPSKLYDIDLLESVQRYFTKRLFGLWDVPYETRLARCGLCSLELRRLRTDVSLCYQIINGLVALNLKKNFEPSPNRITRGNKQKLVLPKTRLATRSNFFACRVVPVWNSLPNDVILSSSYSSFKSQLERVDLSVHLKRSLDSENIT